MFNITNVSPVTGGEGFLLHTDKTSILVDSGFDFCSADMLSNIKNALKDRPLDYIFLTHSHYDHASGVPACRKCWPNVKIVSSNYAKRILSKPTALNLIAEMNEKAANSFGIENYKFSHTEIPVDITVNDGDIVDTGEFKFQVFETPGHTKCTIAYYCESEDFLISNETLGVQMGESFMFPCSLVGYEMTLNSIKKIVDLNPEHLLIPHHGLELNTSSNNLFDEAYKNITTLKSVILEMHASGASDNEICDHLYGLLYTESTKRCQPEDAFILNTSITVPMIIREFDK